MNDDKTKSGWQSYSRNTFGVKQNNDMKTFTNIKKATSYAAMHCQQKIIWLNSNVIITVAEMMISERAQMWEEITKE